MRAKLSDADLERASDLIAAATDRVGPERESLFLAKLSLVLGAQFEGLEQLTEAIRIAEQDLDPGA